MTQREYGYLSVSYLKKYLGLTTDVKIYDEKLDELIFNAEEQVLTELKPYLGSDDSISPDSEIAIQLTKVMAMHARAEWFEHNFQLKKAKYNHERYDSKIESLIASLKADANIRTRRVSTGTSYQTRRLFSQTKRY